MQLIKVDSAQPPARGGLAFWIYWQPSEGSSDSPKETTKQSTLRARIQPEQQRSTS